MTDAELSILADSELLKGLTLLEIRSLVDENTLKKVDFIKDEIIAFQGDFYKELLIVLHGTVLSEISDPTGKCLRLEDFNESAVIAPGILFSIDNILPVTITAASYCTVLCIPREVILNILMSKRICLENYLGVVGNKVNILAEKIRLFKFSSIQQKIAGYLLNLRSKQKSDILNIPYTREQMADSFGVARPSLSREFSRMAEAGIILVEGKKIRLLKTTALKYLLEGEILD